MPPNGKESPISQVMAEHQSEHGALGLAASQPPSTAAEEKPASRRTSMDLQKKIRMSVNLDLGKVTMALSSLSGMGQHSNREDQDCSPVSPSGPFHSVDMDSIDKEPRPLIAVKFEDVKYKVLVKPRQPFIWDVKGNIESFTSKGVEKEILHSLTGSVMPGEVLAMMGPSGSGKTTLLNILGGRILEGVTGNITYNDTPYSKALKRRMGFVTQDDILFTHLTVKETLMYAALLRLPRTMTRAQKLQRTEQVIQDLGLDRCKNTIIGGHFLRGISGGERKRVSIGHEILTDPSIMLLDEPTSGLDSTTALKIMHVLQRLAAGGRTVITTIHQPSSRIFNKFDKLIVLSEGHTIFFGRAKEAMSYFHGLGFRPTFPTNPGDFVLDLATGTTSDIEYPDEIDKKESDEEDDETQATTAMRQQRVKEHLTEAFRAQRLGALMESMQGLPTATTEEKERMKDKREWSTSWLEQCQVLLARDLTERRHVIVSWLRISQTVAIAVIVGLLWFNSEIETEQQIQDQVGMLFFTAIFWGFFPLFSALFAFPQERSVLAKERASDMYRLSAYFVSRTLGDLPMELSLPLIYMIISYWMANLNPNFWRFLWTTLAIFVNTVVAQGLGFVIGASVMDLQKATVMASIILLTFMLAGGYYLQKIPVFIEWVKYLSFNWFGYRLVIKCQYSPDQTYACGDRSPSGDGRCSIAQAPALRTTELGSRGEEVWPLMLMLIGYRFLAYIALRRMKTTV